MNEFDSIKGASLTWANFLEKLDQAYEIVR